LQPVPDLRHLRYVLVELRPARLDRSREHVVHQLREGSEFNRCFLADQTGEAGNRARESSQPLGGIEEARECCTPVRSFCALEPGREVSAGKPPVDGEEPLAAPADFDDLRHLEADVDTLPACIEGAELGNGLVGVGVRAAVDPQHPLVVDREDLALTTAAEQAVAAGVELGEQLRLLRFATPVGLVGGDSRTVRDSGSSRSIELGQRQLP